MLKTIISLQVLAAIEVLGARVLAANEIGDIGGGNRSKCVEPETRKLEGQKSAKSQKSKKPSKSENSLNFDAIKTGPSFLILKARKIFNHLRLAFTKALIFWRFNLECYIWIGTNVSGYAIDSMLSHLASKTRPNGVVLQIDLG